MAINQSSKNIRKTHKNKTKPSTNTHTKKIWLWTIIGILLITVIVVCVVVFIKQSKGLSYAYNKCTEEFATLEVEAEETNSKRYDAVIYFKPNTSEDELKYMSSIMNTFGKVKSIEVSTAEDEYQKLLEENENNAELLETLTDEELKSALADSINPTMRVKAYDISDLSGIKYVVNTNEHFRKSLADDKEPYYNTTSPINFGTLELLDDGKTIIMEIEGNNYSDKINCVCSALDMPDRIKDSVVHTTATDRTKQDTWNDYNVEWSYADNKLHMVIYQR